MSFKCNDLATQACNRFPFKNYFWNSLSQNAGQVSRTKKQTLRDTAFYLKKEHLLSRRDTWIWDELLVRQRALRHKVFKPRRTGDRRYEECDGCYIKGRGGRGGWFFQNLQLYWECFSEFQLIAAVSQIGKHGKHGSMDQSLWILTLNQNSP